MNKEEKIHIKKCNKFREEFKKFINKREKENSNKYYDKKDKLIIELAHRSINKDGTEIKNIPMEYVDYKLCLEAVKQNGKAIEHILSVPVSNMSYKKMIKICKIAIKNEPLSLEYLPINYKTKDLCYNAVNKLKEYKRYGDIINIIDYIPDTYKTFDFYYNLLSYAPNIIKKIPKNIINEKLCYIAVSHDGWCLKYIPNEYLTFTICKKAIFTEGRRNTYNYISRELFKYIPIEYRNDIMTLAELKFERSY